MFKKILLTLVTGLSIFSLQVQSVDAAGLVPCGGIGEDPCTFCHLIVGIKGIIDWLTGTILIIAALFVITVAGVMWMLGDSFGLVSQAKKAISNTIAGIVVVFTAWLMIIFVLSLFSARDLGSDGVRLTKTGTWDFECSTESFIGGEVESSDESMIKSSKVKCGSGKGDCSLGSPIGNIFEGMDGNTYWQCVAENGKTINCPTDPPGVGENNSGAKKSGYKTEDEKWMEESNREVLEIKNGIGINKKACEYHGQTNCTDVGGLKYNTLYGVIGFKNDCGKDCKVTITGGSEGAVHKAGTYSHGNGYKVDLRLNDNVNKYIESNYKDVGIRSDGAKVYHDGKGNYYAKEGDHWDACYGCNSPTGKK